METYGFAALYALGSLPTAAAVAPWVSRKHPGFRAACILGWPVLSVVALAMAIRRSCRAIGKV